MKEKYAINFVKSFNAGIYEAIAGFTEEELKNAPITTKTGKYFIEDLCVEFVSNVKRYDNILKGQNVKMVYFDKLFCLVMTLITKEIITISDSYLYEDKFLHINDKVITEILLTYLSYSKWKINNNTQGIQFDYELFNDKPEVLESYKKELLDYVVDKNVKGICTILEKIYITMVQSYLGLDDASDIVKNIKIFDSTTTLKNCVSVPSYSQSKKSFRDSYLRNAGYQIKILTNDNKNTHD